MLRAAFVFSALLFALSAPAFAEPPEPAPGPETAPVVIDGYELFRLRGISARPAQQRATEIADRIEAVAADRSIPAKSLRLLAAEEQTRILSGERLIMVISNADADVEGMPKPVLSEIYLDKIKVTIERYRNERNPRALLVSGVYAAAATVVVAVVIFMIIRLSRKLERWIDNRYQEKFRGVRIQSVQLIQAERFWRGVHSGLHAIRAVLILLFCLVYINYTCNLFPWTRPLARRGEALLLDPLRTMGSSIAAAVPNLAFIIVLAVILRYILKLAHLFFSGIEHGTVTISGFDREWAMPTYKILRMLVIAFGVVVAYPYIPGAQSDAFKGVSMFVGIVFSLGSTSAVANIIAGYMMTYRRAFKVGDRVQVMDITGDVTEIRLQVTHIRSLKNEEIIVPNSQILNSHVINYSRLAKEYGLILHTTIGVGYEAPWRQVEAMLLLAAERTPGLLREPPPFVLQKEFGDFSVKYEINVYSDHPQDSPKLYTALHRNILDLFNEYGVQIMTPAYEGDPERAKVVPKEQWFAAPANEISDKKE